jgi:hypothetical protein
VLESGYGVHEAKTLTPELHTDPRQMTGPIIILHITTHKDT